MPQPMPLISRNAPAYTNDDFAGSFPAAHANNGVYGGTDYWRCATTPTGNANSGTLTQAVYLAYDLSSVPALQRQNVVLAWYNDFGTGPYRPDLISNNPNNLPTSYTIDVNTAAGGTYPSTGWSTLATVSGSSPYHSRQHLVNMNGANWIRINVTAITGSVVNNNVSLNMDVHDAHLGAQDSWIFYGDSITQRGFMHDDQGGIGSILPVQINAVRSAFYPLWECGGVGGWTATDAQPNFAAFLALFPGQYVALNFGTNDANLGGSYVTNFQTNMQSMITAALNAGKTVVIPTIPWINTTSQAQTNVNTLNSVIATLISSNPGCIAGPDLYTFFSTHQSDISNDGIHPTDPALSQGNGYVDYRAQWVNWATTSIYFNTLNTAARTLFKVRAVLKTGVRTAYKVRSVLKTLAHTAFKVQFVTTIRPYKVASVSTQLAPRPGSTISSTATVIDATKTLTDGLTASVTVTFPDKSTATPGVDAIGGGTGTYTATYTTKGAGTITEVWTFTDSYGSQAEYQNTLTCSF